MKFLLFAIVFSALLVAGCVQQPSVPNQNESGVSSEPSPTSPVPRDFLNMTIDGYDYPNYPVLTLVGTDDVDYNLRISTPNGDPRITIDLWSYSSSERQQPLAAGRTYDVSFGAMRARLLFVVPEGIFYESREDGYEFVVMLDSWPLQSGQKATGRFQGILVEPNTNRTVTVRGNFAVTKPEFSAWPTAAIG